MSVEEQKQNIEHLKQEIAEFGESLKRQLTAVNQLISEYQRLLEEARGKFREATLSIEKTVEKLSFSPSQKAELMATINDLLEVFKK